MSFNPKVVSRGYFVSLFQREADVLTGVYVPRKSANVFFGGADAHDPFRPREIEFSDEATVLRFDVFIDDGEKGLNVADA